MKHSLGELPLREAMPGFRGRFVHGENVTLAYWMIERGAQLASHAHPHEQVVNLLDGVFELVVDETPHVLRKGDVFTIPGNAVHSGRALTSCWILDVFCPIREDYRSA